MKMNFKQSKLIDLTKELELAALEYKNICAELEEIKSLGLDSNHPSLLKLLSKFRKNKKKIIKIKEQLKGLKSEE